MTRRQDTNAQERDEKRDAPGKTPNETPPPIATKSTRERAEPMTRERPDGDENQHELTQSKLNHT